MSFQHLQDYRQILQWLIKRQPGVTKTGLAERMGCQPSYLSRVLGGEAELNVDQVSKASDYLALTPSEKEYWIFCLLENRAESQDVKKIFRKKKAEIAKTSGLQKNLSTPPSMSDEWSQFYYQSWDVSAAHMAVRIPELRTIEALAEALNISDSRARKILSGLERLGMVERRKDEYVATLAETHATEGWARQHRLNYTHHQLQRLVQSQIDPDDLFYCASISCSELDYFRIREMLIEFLEKSRRLIRNSEDERLSSLTIDLSSVWKTR